MVWLVRSAAASAALVLLLASIPTLGGGSGSASSCSCSDSSLCKPLDGNGGRSEFFGFSLTSKNWKKGYDFSRLTTIAWNTDPELVCAAHAHKTRVVMNAGGAPVNGTESERAKWIDEQVATAQAGYLDGINFDFEGAVAGPGRNDPLNGRYVALLKETAEAFHTRVGNNTVVSVDVAWSPYNIDGRAYNYADIAEAADLLFVMAYDTRSQIYHQSLAAANTPIGISTLGIRNYLDIGVPPEKLVLGLPWYGYNYTCNQGPSAVPESEWRQTSKICPIACVPFRGAPCSDAAGREVGFSTIAEILRGENDVFSVVPSTEKYFDEVMQSPFFNFVRRDGLGSTYQMRYDSPASIKAKVKAARDMVEAYPGLSGRKLAGFGVWELDQLAYVNASSAEQKDTHDMYAAFD